MIEGLSVLNQIPDSLLPTPFSSPSKSKNWSDGCDHLCARAATTNMVSSEGGTNSAVRAIRFLLMSLNFVSNASMSLAARV